MVDNIVVIVFIIIVSPLSSITAVLWLYCRVVAVFIVAGLYVAVLFVAITEEGEWFFIFRLFKFIFC